MKHDSTPTLIKILLQFIGNKALKDLNKHSLDCRNNQEKVFQSIIKYAKNTEYGKKHHFSEITSMYDFRNKVPINTYQTLEPYINKHTQGHTNILIPEKPLLYATTSGTTKRPKTIPITRQYYKKCYQQITRLWLSSILLENPTAFSGKALSIVGKAIEGYTDDGTPLGSMSGYSYQHIPFFLKPLYSSPSQVFYIDDYDSRYYCYLRFALEQNITLIISANPSTLIELHNVASRRIDELITDIKNGTLSSSLNLSLLTRKQLKKHLKPNPVRAHELQEMLNKNGTLKPKDYWPNLAVINTWRCGNSGLYLKQSEGLYPDQTKIREFSYFSTEARAGIVIKNDQIASILPCNHLFFEFIKKEDIEKPEPPIYLAHEVETNQDYYILLTTWGGLYRYNINDIVRVDGFYNQYPMIRFIQKGKGVTSLTGEKLSEEQLIMAVKESESIIEPVIKFFIGFADFNKSCYKLYMEFDQKITDNELNTLARLIDEKLKANNMEYQAKSDSHRIKPLIIHPLPTGAFEKIKLARMHQGYRDGQFKLVHLNDNKKLMELVHEISKTFSATNSEI